MIERLFLSDVSQYVDNRIHSVRLNGTFRITKFHVKEVQDTTVSMEFLVPFGSVGTIEEIELLDHNEQLISSNSVNVPITSDTVILHAFEVKEG